MKGQVGKKFLDSLFVPGKGHMARTTNRFRRGYLKRSIFRPWAWYKPHQGEKECARRRRQLASGMIVNARRAT